MAASLPAPNCKFPEQENVKYVVVCRNPEEALVSFRHMIMNHDPRNWALWNTPMEEAKEMWYRDDFKTW